MKLQISLFLLSGLLQYMQYGTTDAGILGVQLSVPPSHVALSGDLHLQILSESGTFPPLLLQLSRLDDDGATVTPLTTFPVLPDARAIVLKATPVRVPCGYFSRGGQYYVLVKKQVIGNGSDDGGVNAINNSKSTNFNSDVLMQTLDVRWPMPQLRTTPELIQTYPERSVSAILEFPLVVCPPVADTAPAAIPEFWLQLRYCGHSLLTCDDDDDGIVMGGGGGSSVIGGEGVGIMVHGKNDTAVNKILFSEQVRGFPGRRLFTLRCEFFGLAGYYSLVLKPSKPTPSLPHTAVYVKADWSESFVFNVHASSIYPCDPHSGGIKVLFQYPACIVTGDRVRLFARLRADVASLAPPTSLEYVAEHRVRRGEHVLHFDCDLFSERYVEYCFVYVSQAITGAVADVREDCVPTLPVSESEEGGWSDWSPWTPCSTTCLGGTKSRYRFCDSPPPRYGAKYCKGDAVETVRCGHSLGNGWECFYTVGANSAGAGAPAAVGGSANDVVSSVAETAEVAAEVGEHCLCGCIVHLGHNTPRRLLATSSHTCPGRIYWQIQAEEECTIQIKVEQFRMPCGSQYLKIRDGLRPSDSLLEDLSDPNMPPSTINSTGSNLLLEFYSDDISTYNQYCGGGFLAYAIQLKHDHTNGTGIPIAQSIGVLPLVALKLTAVHVAAIFFLSGLIIATALLGAQYMVRYRKYHIAQAEDQDSLADGSSCNSIPLTVRAASSNATLLSEVISLHRLRPFPRIGGGNSNSNNQSTIARHKHTRLRESMDCDEEVMTESGDDDVTTMSTTALSSSEVGASANSAGGGVTLAKEEESLSLSSTSTLTPEGTNPTTASDAKQITREYDEEDMNKDLSASTTSSQLLSEGKELKRSSTIVSSDKDQSTEKEDVCVQLYVRRPSNTSVANLTNGSYSPALSTTSTATVRSTNIKESKDKRNRERLLAGPVGSEFSLVGPDVDLELDYYDYNVMNAGAAPGSYLGMDPAFLVWIPPLDDSGEILDESGEVQMKPQPVYIDPKSNSESPEEEELLLPKQRQRSFSEDNTGREPLLMGPKPKFKASILLEAQKRLRIRSKNNSSEEIVSIQLHEYPVRSKEKKVAIHREKETRVEKSPSSEVSSLDDIKFADDEEEDNRKESDSNRCDGSKMASYHDDLNIETSNE